MSKSTTSGGGGARQQRRMRGLGKVIEPLTGFVSLAQDLNGNNEPVAPVTRARVPE